LARFDDNSSAAYFFGSTCILVGDRKQVNIDGAISNSTHISCCVDTLRPRRAAVGYSAVCVKRLRLSCVSLSGIYCRCRRRSVCPLYWSIFRAALAAKLLFIAFLLCSRICRRALTHFVLAVFFTVLFVSRRCFFFVENNVVYPVPATGTRSSRIAYRQSAINNSLAPIPTLNLAITLTLTLN